jgi:FtsZ-interacting cell division protein YlmF
MVDLGLNYMMFLKDYLQYEKYKKTEKQGSRKAGKQRSRKTGKQRSRKKQKSKKKRSRKAKKQGNRNQTKNKMVGKKNRPPQYNTAYGYLHWEFNQQ